MKKLDQSKFLKNFTSTGIDVPTVSMVYKTSRYVGQFPLMTKSGFSEFHVDVFYEPNPESWVILTTSPSILRWAVFTLLEQGTWRS